jgi:FkbM family methyltransferase
MSDYFFPNQSPEALRLEAIMRAEAAKLPEDARLTLYGTLSSSDPGFAATTFVLDAVTTCARQRGGEIAFPRPVPLVKLSHILFGYEEWLRRKYCLPGFVEVEPGDVVVDCGAYVGGFSLSAARVARELHAFEPEQRNFACVLRNLTGFSNATANNAGLYCETKTASLNLSASSVEHSLLMPDDGAPVGVADVQVVTLEDYCASRGINRLDFVKIEAEGVELEVFAGLGALRPRKLAIDVSPERNGESPAEEFRALLQAAGYEVRQRGYVMFARREPSPAAVMHVSETAVPRTIYSMWQQGFGQAPEIVRAALQRWAALNPEYELRLLDRTSVGDLLSGLAVPPETLSPQALSDLVRARTLLTRGGVWADATVFPVRPLREWLPKYSQPAGFFAFAKPTEDRPLSSWFIASSPGHPLLVKWWGEIERYWSKRRTLARFDESNPVDAGQIATDPVREVAPEDGAQKDTYPYFWFHYLFFYLLARDDTFAAEWARCTKRSAAPAQRLLFLFDAGRKPALAEIAEAMRAAPLHKLNWRCDYPLDLFADISREILRAPAPSRALARMTGSTQRAAG